MAIIAMREMTNPTGITRTAGNTKVVYAEDVNEIKDALTDGTLGINPLNVQVGGVEVITSAQAGAFTSATIGDVSGGDYFNVSATGVPTYVDSDIGTSAQMFVVKNTVAYTDTSAKTLATLPTDAVVWRIEVLVTTAFDDSGTDLLDIGVTGTAAYYADDLDVSSTGWLDGMTTLGSFDKLAGSTNIIATYTGQNTDSTAGAADVYIHYTRH